MPWVISGLSVSKSRGVIRFWLNRIHALPANPVSIKKTIGKLKATILGILLQAISCLSYRNLYSVKGINTLV